MYVAATGRDQSTEEAGAVGAEQRRLGGITESTTVRSGRRRSISTLVLTVSAFCPTDKILCQLTLGLSFFLCKVGRMPSSSITSL